MRIVCLETRILCNIQFVLSNDCAVSMYVQLKSVGFFYRWQIRCKIIDYFGNLSLKINYLKSLLNASSRKQCYIINACCIKYTAFPGYNIQRKGNCVEIEYFCRVLSFIPRLLWNIRILICAKRVDETRMPCEINTCANMQLTFMKNSVHRRFRNEYRFANALFF